MGKESKITEPLITEELSLNEESASAAKTTTDEAVINDINSVDKLDGLVDMFTRRSVVEASKKERKKMYEQENILTPLHGDEITVSTVASEKLREYTIISDAARTRPKTALTGIVEGVDPMNEVLNTPCAIVSLAGSKGFYNILIPAKLFFHFGDSDTFSPDQQVSEIMYRLGSKIRFVPFFVEEGKPIVASRLHAMEIDVAMSYINPIKKNQPLIVPGLKDRDKFQANVMKVSNTGIVVEANGAECYIDSRELSYNRIVNVSDEYQPGDTVLVKILSAEPYEVTVNNFKFKLMKIEASVKQSQPRPDEVFYESFKIGQICKGTVKQTSRNGKYFVTLANKMDALCTPPPSGTPVPNQTCSVVITDLKDGYEGANQIWGKIIHLGRATS